MYPLQLNWFLEYVPPWLGTALLGAGLGTIVVVFTIVSITSSEVEDAPLPFKIAVVGAFLTAVPLYLRYSTLFAAFLFLCGRWIEGVAATRFLQRCIDALAISNRGGIRGTIYRFLLRRMGRFFGVVLTVIVAGWIGLAGLILYYPDQPLTLRIAFVWTVLIACLSIFGLVWKFRSVFAAPLLSGEVGVRSNVTFVAVMVAGLIVAVVGAQIFNFQLLSAQIEITAQVGLQISVVELSVIAGGYLMFIVAFLWSTKVRIRRM